MDRDEHFRLSIVLRQAIFEPLTLIERYVVDGFFEIIQYDNRLPVFYKRCRSLVWDEVTQYQFRKFLRLMRTQTSRSRSNILSSNESQTVEEMIVYEFLRLFCRMAISLERLKIIGLPYLYLELCNFAEVEWLELVRSLRELTIIVGGIHPQFRAARGNFRPNNDPLVRVYAASDNYFDGNHRLLEKIYLRSNERLYDYFVEEYVLDRLRYKVAPYVRTIATNPYQVFEEISIHKIPKFTHLQAYTVRLFDRTPPPISRRPIHGGPLRLIDLWRHDGDILAPPAQIRRLTLQWIGSVCSRSLIKVFLHQLTRFVSLHSLDLTLSFKTSNETASEKRQMIEQFLHTTRNIIAQQHQWSYRSLRLAFPDVDAHNVLDQTSSPIEESTDEVHLAKHSSLFSQLFCGSNATNLVELWLAPNQHVSLFKVESPNIRSLHLDFRFCQQSFPRKMSLSLFGSFPCAVQVETLSLYNFSPLGYGTSKTFTKMFRYFGCLFPNLTTIRLCCNESIAGVEEMIDSVLKKSIAENDTDKFYLLFDTLVNDFVQQLFDQKFKYNTTTTDEHHPSVFTRLHLTDSHHKPYEFVIRLVEQFVKQASKYPDKLYLLLFAQCKVVHRYTLEDGKSTSDSQVNIQNRLQSIQTVYDRWLDSANSVSNFRLIVPKIVEAYHMISAL